MANQPEQILEEQIYFLKNQFWALTIQAAFGRAYVYNKTPQVQTTIIEKERMIFRRAMYSYLNNEIIPELEASEDLEKDVLLAIKNLQDWSASRFKSILKGGALTFGVCQKIINLYLKYLWCARLINFTPPFFLLDRLIQERELKKVLINWTTFDNKENEYENILNEICSENTKAEWELTTYNRILKNG